MNSFRKAWKLSSTLLALIVFAVASLGATPAMAAAFTYTVSQSIPIDFLVYVPCANQGAGEYVELTGSLHDLFHITVDNNGGFHLKTLDNPQGISGNGMTTGAKYQGTGETGDEINGTVGYETTYMNNFKIVGQGPGNNYMIHENLHITVHADGTVTSYVDNFSAECK